MVALPQQNQDLMALLYRECIKYFIQHGGEKSCVYLVPTSNASIGVIFKRKKKYSTCDEPDLKNPFAM